MKKYIVKSKKKNTILVALNFSSNIFNIEQKVNK